jgi:hypothetical protein
MASIFFLHQPKIIDFFVSRKNSSLIIGAPFQFFYTKTDYRKED